MDGAGTRIAGIGDIDELVALARACADELRPLRGGAMLLATAGRQEPMADRFAQELNDPTALVLCGTYDEAVVGYAVTILTPDDEGRRHARVTDLHTLPDARHVGVGEAMLDAILAWSRQHGAASIDAVVLPGARESKNFFESFGLTARALVVNRPL